MLIWAVSECLCGSCRKSERLADFWSRVMIDNIRWNPMQQYLDQGGFRWRVGLLDLLQIKLVPQAEEQ